MCLQLQSDTRCIPHSQPQAVYTFCAACVLLLQALQSFVQQDALGPQLLLRPGVVGGLMSMLRQPHLAAVQAWPDHACGGQRGVASLVAAVSMLLHAPFLHPPASEPLLKDLQEVVICFC